MRPRGRLSHRTVVELLGDSTVLAQALGIAKRNSVQHWKRADRGIPALYWLQISTMARARGYDISVADLARTSPVARAKRQRSRLPPEDNPDQGLAA